MASYSIWLLEYARCTVQPVSSVLYGQHNKGVRLLSFSYCVLQGEGHTIMLDVGYDYARYGKDLADRYGVTDWQPPDNVLGKIGLRPDDVDTVILTHAHFDHMGNIRAFPRAHVFLQKRELLDWVWALSLPRRFTSLATAMDPQDILNAYALSFEERLTLLDGAVQNIRPGIHALPAFDGHTFGNQVVVIDTLGAERQERWAYAGDTAYSYENIRGVDNDGIYRAVGLATGSTVNMLMSIDDMVKTVDGDINRIIVGHDPTSWSIYPSRQTPEDGLHVAELSLAPGQRSRL